MNKKSPGRAAMRPCALTIAGSDSGGGAGIQADLKTFSALGVHGTTAITCLTAQNPVGVRSVQAVRPAIIRDQVEAVFEELPPAAVKTGMLFSADIIRTVAEVLEPWRRRGKILVVDPVMVATSGAMLLRPSAVAILKTQLLPACDLVTPNLQEAEVLLGRKINDVVELRASAREIHSRFGCAALVKGGHLPGMDRAIDFYYDGKSELLLEAPFVRGVATHGTGCTYSAAIAAQCALGNKLSDAVAAAKGFITSAIAASYRTASHSILNSFWES